MKFAIGEKVKAGGEICTVVNRHPTKNVLYLRLDNGSGWWFEEREITKIDPISEIPVSSPKKQAHERNIIHRQKHSRKGTRRDFLRLD